MVRTAWLQRPPLVRRDWLPELVVLLTAALLTVVVFALTPLDLAVARAFYRPGAPNSWPLAERPLARLLYGAAPWVTASLVLVGLAMLATSVLRRRDRLRREAIFLLAAVVIGPGVIVNGVFKDHWHRPRPRDVVELGGTRAYVPPLLRGSAGGGSFPCGHCSVGFLYAAGWWIWKRRRPVRARLALAAGMAAGSGIGLARMAAGGHFLSDIVWSALLALGIAHALYHYVLRLPAHERAIAAGAPATTLPPLLQHALVAAAAAGGVVVLLALFAMPHGTPVAARLPLQGARALEVTARRADVEVVIVDAPARDGAEVVVQGELHGFGLPQSKLGTRTLAIAGSPPAVRFEVVEDGWFTDLDCQLRVEVPSTLERVAVRVEDGNLRARDVSRGGVVRAGRLRLALVTAHGSVNAAAGPR